MLMAVRESTSILRNDALRLSWVSRLYIYRQEVHREADLGVATCTQAKPMHM